MRSVSLSNPVVRNKINDSFVPLKVKIDHGAKKFPLDWPAMRKWQVAYFLMGGKNVKGITACCVVSPDLKLELGTTGSAFVWELFDSVAYDATKFATMLDDSLLYFNRYREILKDRSLGKFKRRRMLANLNREIKKGKNNVSGFRLPPKGFKKDDAIELFRLSGDLK